MEDSGLGRQRSRGISFRSDRSGGSKELVESPREKDRKSILWQGGTKANPNAALNEQQPAVLNVVEESTLQNLRDMEHKDAAGQVIVEPDLSNPTRPRFERPLDTIRSFEKAIDAGYKRRSSYVRQDSADEHHNQYASRRSSYFGGYDNPNRSASGQGGYYGQSRPESTYMNGGRQRYSRMQSEPNFYGGQQQRPYGQHGYHQSHDTVQTGGSDSTGPWANSTDPSSENSSLDRGMQQQYMNKQPSPMDGGYHGGYNVPIQEEHAAGGPVRRPIALGGSGGASSPANLPSMKRSEPEKKEKRKSFFKRFSRAE